MRLSLTYDFQGFASVPPLRAAPVIHVISRSSFAMVCTHFQTLSPI